MSLRRGMDDGCLVVDTYGTRCTHPIDHRGTIIQSSTIEVSLSIAYRCEQPVPTEADPSTAVV
jgi:hypothetical protein